MLGTLARTSTAALRRSAATRVSAVPVRTFAGGSGSMLPEWMTKIIGGTEPDNLIATDRDRKLKKGDFPDYIPEDVKKDMEEMGLDNMSDLDDLEEANSDGYNDLGLVPPEGTGTFKSPILVPSRRASRQVGYVDPASHAVFWFTIHNDENTYYIKDLGLFFKMLHIPGEEAAAH
mmetsp:Transcript_20524/g.56654  ORF Transcript_20524/g.56654 Transcript_20524/m.56654 type:complete len:175 (-) Transcript_20524:87-611(-)